VRALAAQLHARIEWSRGGEQTLVKALKKRRLDLVIGGITRDTPWAKTAASTRAFASKHVWLAPAGENGWLLSLNDFLQTHDPETGQ